jgi:hypothetical protein
MDGTNCHKYAHRICVDAWETKYRMPEHSNGNFCQAHYPMIEQLESMEPDKEAVALKDYVVALKLNFDGNDEENHNAKLGTSRAFVNIVQNPKQWPRCHCGRLERNVILKDFIQVPATIQVVTTMPTPDAYLSTVTTSQLNMMTP